MIRKVINIMLESDVAANATDVTASDILPAGKWAQLTEYGGSAPDLGDMMAIQYGSAASGWTTVRAWYHSGNFTLEREVTGDGTKRFRFVRVNSTGTAKPIYGWATIIVDEAA